MRLFISLVVSLSLFYVNAAITNDFPMFIYSRIKSTNSNSQIPIGSTINQNDFRSYLKNLFPEKANQNVKAKKIGIILVPTLQWIDILTTSTSACADIDSDLVQKFPSVQSGYTALKEYLDDSHFKIDILQKDQLVDGFKLFCDLKNQKFDKYDGLVLTTLDLDGNLKNENVHERHIRSDKNYGIDPNTTDSMLFGDSCAALFNNIIFVNSTSTSSVAVPLVVDINNSKLSCVNDTASLELKLTGNKDLTDIQLTFKIQNLVWRLTDGLVKTTNRSFNLNYTGLPSNMETPLKYSFACTSTRFRLSDQTNQKPLLMEIYMNGFQIQPFNIQVSNSSYTFGQVNYCDGFFTNGIWMGIISSLLMAFILSIGVYLMVSINTMDRFDDPKGKPLSLAAEK